MLSKGSVQLDIQNNQKRTPLLEAVSQGHLGMTHKLIALGANVNAVDGEGNSCLHLAVERKKFNSEDAPLDLLNECCTSLNLKEDEMLSGVVVGRYLASQGADFHHKNNKYNTPLDLIKDPNLRRKLEAFLPPQCLWCRNKAATTKVHPCGHLVICKGCSNVTLQRCLKCGKPVTSRTGDGAPKCEDRCVQTEATCQELGAASQAIGSPVLKERDLLRVAKRLGRDWWQVVIVLEVDTTKLKIDDESNVTVKQGHQILYEWFKNCDPETRTHATLRAALEEAECFAAMECLSLDAK
ncbi:E3 ubiquitin-protein ligase MIB2-like isoform X7 [Octopus sinensis]|uniref:E3 ubiquitin-protein ligase MIB2-like isoform X7 n=1 Tax=Octopus sinensis TaxID=2607531 RepID=A0A6P7U7C5_9MOLL|nr:E3 ubiquitin-protein ligase MIB2-like isoform X7 [Octopus sinensis]